jgi:glyoxalase family protein
MATGGDAPGHWIDVLQDASAPHAKNGLGTVHHVAMAIGSGEEQAALREALLTAGARVTEIRDRQYFTSIYFREPGGVLFEVATIAPGFAVDEPLDALGRALKLPPWEEPHRAEIERGLAAIRYRA